MLYIRHATRTGSLLLLGTTLLCGTSTTALAAGTVETVIVTAEKRETSLQKTPIAIDTLSGDQLEAGQIRNTSDLQLHVPGFVMSTNIVHGEAYIRGIGTDIASIAADPSVAFMVDGVYMPRLSTSLQDLYDVDRVEVVKGPQGTLYGRNATGGVINIISKLPSDVFEMDADALYGNYNQQRYRFSLSGPLGDDASARLSLMHQSRDGYVKNLFLGGTVDPSMSWAGRGSVRFQPRDDLDIVISADFSSDGGAPGSAIHVLSADAPAVLFFGGTVTSDPYTVLENLHNQVKNDQGGGSARIKWDTGNVVFTSLSSYRTSRFKLVLDLDGTEINWFTHEPDLQTSKAFSQEFQLASRAGDAFEWIAGAYYFNENAHSNYNLFLPLFGVNVNPDATNLTNAYAVYGQGTYHLTETLSFTAGLRYNDEHKKANLTALSHGVPLASVAAAKSWDALTPKFGVQYSPNDDVMLYASATRGFKSGGFNSTAIQTPQGFDPEFVWSYEGGVKSTWLDQRLRLNLSAFYYNYSNLQVNKYDAVNIVTLENAAEATVEGLEVETEFVPVEDLTFAANLAFLDPTYQTFVSVDPDHPLLGPISLAGNQMVRAPKFTANVSGQYLAQLGTSGSLTSRVEYFHRSRIYFTPFDNSDVSQGAFSLWNASLRFDDNDGRWSASAFVNNIGNTLYYQEKARSASIVGTIGWPGIPRTYGVSVSVHL